MGSEALPSPLSQSILVPLEPWNKMSKIVQAPIHKKLYQPLKGEQSAPKDEVHAHAGIFGGLAELTAPGYTSLEAFSAKKKEVLTSVQTQVCLPQEDSARRNFVNMLEESSLLLYAKNGQALRLLPRTNGLSISNASSFLSVCIIAYNSCSVVVHMRADSVKALEINAIGTATMPSAVTKP